MNKNYEVKDEIQQAIEYTYSLKCIMDSIIDNLNNKLDFEIIERIRQKAIKLEKKLEKIIRKLPDKTNYALLFSKKSLKSRQIQLTKDSKKPKHYFKKLIKSSLINFSIFPEKSSNITKVPEILTNLQKKCSENLVPGLISLTFKELEFNDHYKLKATLLLGINVVIKCYKGKLKSIKFMNLGENSENRSIFLSLLENYCENEFEFLGKQLIKCLEKAASWVNHRRMVYTSHCSSCGHILDFYSGKPLLPLWYHNSAFYHLTCFFDVN